MKHFLNRKQLGRHGFIRKGVLLLFSVIFLFPLYWMVCLSFKTQSEASASPFSPPRSFSFDNFKSVLNQIDIAGGMLNSFLYAFAGLRFLYNGRICHLQDAQTLGEICGAILCSWTCRSRYVSGCACFFDSEITWIDRNLLGCCYPMRDR